MHKFTLRAVTAKVGKRTFNRTLAVTVALEVIVQPDNEEDEKTVTLFDEKNPMILYVTHGEVEPLGCYNIGRIFHVLEENQLYPGCLPISQIHGIINVAANGASGRMTVTVEDF